MQKALEGIIAKNYEISDLVFRELLTELYDLIVLMQVISILRKSFYFLETVRIFEL